MTIDILICSYGDRAWRDLAWSRAYPSAIEQAADNVQVWHDVEADCVALVRNRAAFASRADWLCFLDADDELASGYIPAMREAAKKQVGLTLLVPAVQFIDTESGHRSPVGIPNRGRWPEVNEAVIGTLVQRDLFIRVGGFEAEWPIYEDYALWLACEREGAILRYVESAVYLVHQRSSGRNSQPSSTVKIVTYNEIRRRDKWAREGEKIEFA